MENNSGSIIKVLVLLLTLLLLSCAGVEDKRESKAHYKLGVSYLSSGQHQAAYVEFQKAMNLNPKDKEIHNALGIVSLKLEDPESAEGYFTNAVELDPGYSEAFNNLCFLYVTIGQYDKATESCLEALGNPIYTTPEKAFYNLGRAYYMLGDYARAVESFKNAVRRYPSLLPAYYGLALAYNATHNYGKAAEAMTKAIELDPRFKGNGKKADEEFRRQLAARGGVSKDISDYIEILKY
jgi:Tfp pilus assembly protein PilF